MENNKYFAIITDQEKALPFYVATIGITQNEKRTIRRKGIEHYQLLYCAEGEGAVLINGEERKITKGMGFFLPPDTRHYYFATAEPWKTYWITFSGMAVPQVLSLGACVFRITHMDLLDKLFFDILKLPRDSLWSEKSTVRLYTLLLQLKKYIAIDASSSIYDCQLRLKPVTEYIEKNYSNPIELNELSTLVGVTSAHLCRLFKAAYNARPFEYITRLRLQKAKELLVSKPELNISQISDTVGYGSSSYFGFLFKKHEEMTPEAFRELHMHRR